jgi:hypothetical protein
MLHLRQVRQAVPVPRAMLLLAAHLDQKLHREVEARRPMGLDLAAGQHTILAVSAEQLQVIQVSAEVAQATREVAGVAQQILV